MVYGFGWFGALIPTVARPSVPVVFQSGKVTMEVQSILDQIMPAVYNSLPILLPSLKDRYNMAIVISKKLEGSKGTAWNQVYSSIDICTPNLLHYEQVKNLANRGINIYCEKPMALNYDDSKEMDKLSKEKELITQVALIYRFMPSIDKENVIIDKGYLGEIINFRGQLLPSSYLNPKRGMNWRLRKEESGGGAIVDLGVHVSDTLLFLLGDRKIKSLTAKTNTVNLLKKEKKY